MTESKKAVFLSYASEDAAAALKICTALRAAGIEVWFDQSELRGGDSWDQKIRREIRDCALFIPIISANTQARTEGYFRLEWRLADQRTHLMGKSRAFLVPVCIDDTRDADADTPDSFAAVQWTRLIRGEPPHVFVERISRLLIPDEASRSVTVRPATSSVFPLADRPAWPAAAAVSEKSIAVLPFADMSPARDHEYFSDGLAEALIELLTQVRDLRVPARTSSFSFKG
ncbi:MAG: TIR domain-containing protein, partial [Steroidobacteraceae bacterium]